MISFELEGGEKLSFVWCPPGSYKQITKGTSLSHKTGKDLVEVIFNKGFWMSNTSVTNGQWTAVMGKSYFEVGTFSRNTPVYGVNFWMVMSFIDKLNGLHLKSEDLQEEVLFSLPNYLQMRYGSFSRTNDNDPLFWEEENAKFSDFCWFNENSNNLIHDVGLKKPSPWGLYDMFGNILEMSVDVAAYQSQSIIVDPISIFSEDETLFAVGGEYNSQFDRCISNMNTYLEYQNEYREPYGFRLVF
ncbi:SUMF1/EgtB/PvdO family nonheme iron enzyme [Chitinophaga sp. CF418]|uniref:formylglycine-generating enzyme family protein n=1 Tax=Chitinophaga sp. CF418 TaxID=1855287 RepID=UPI000910541D|nr:SUMF1/EgtB/PvdO family nonheme iron enzyme [Chitinophaga sp. CF418]SHN08008.1 Sulfatase-modifying factor enzyme 1 [Chitinophaga sp. CF418]